MAKKKQKGLIGNLLMSNLKDIINTVTQQPRMEQAIQQLFPKMPPKLVADNAEFFGQYGKDVLLPLVK